MIKRLFTLLIFFCFTTPLLSQSAFQSTQTINTLDTVVFDLSQAIVTGNHVEFPVSILSDDTVYSLDFSLKYNQTNLVYDTIINLTNYLQPFSFYNTNDSTLRFTSYSLQQISNDTSLVSVGFDLLGGLLTNSDLYTLKAYLNGIQCSIKLSNVSFIGIDEIKRDDSRIRVYPNPVKDFLDIETTENSTVQMFDFNNRQIASSIKVNSNQKQIMDVRGYCGGVYFLKITDGHLESIKKIIVHK